MTGGIQWKVCGLRRPEDARLAAELGADFLAVNLYEKSPRYLALADYAASAAEWPAGPGRVAVLVEPTAVRLTEAMAAGFDQFQIHARHDLEFARVAEWSALVGPERLWLAPKLPPGAGFPESWIPLAETFLADTYHTEGYGGSGRTGDWSGFARLQAAFPGKRWILAGGLGPDNVLAALAGSGTRFIDVNSGVETAPGVKSPEKLRALVDRLAEAR